MLCPRCHDSFLDEVERDGVTVDVCRKCRGIWLDRGELEKLRAASLDAPRPRYADGPPPRAASYDDDRWRHDDDDRWRREHGDRRPRKRGLVDLLGELID